MMVKDLNEYPCGNCANCPRVTELRERAEGFREMAQAIGTATLGEAPEIFAERMLEMLPEGLRAGFLTPEDDEITPIESPEELVKAMRAHTTNFLEFMDEKREGIKGEIADLSDGCPGPLKMRAEKAGQLVTVTVCMSPESPDGKTAETTTVLRESRVHQ